MTFSHPYGTYNVQNSINYYIRQTLGTSVPSWMTWNYGVSQPRTLNFNYPDQPLNFPSFSVTHHTASPQQYTQGDKADGVYKGIIRTGQMEINCWTSELLYDNTGQPSGKNEKWMLQLQQMRDMVVLMFEKNRYMQIYDLTDPNNPSALTAVARVMDMREVDVLPDPNPAVHRIRIIVTYQWTERWS